MKVRLSKNTGLTPDVIKSLIDSHKKEITRLDLLDSYYRSNAPIMKRRKNDPTKSNNKLVTNYARYITTMSTGYFVGIPVQTRCKDENLLDRLTAIFKYNDEPDLNTTLATNNSKYGYSYELHYMDEQGRNRMAAVDPREIIYITDNTLNDEPTAAIRYFEIKNAVDDNKKIYSIEVYTKDSILYYSMDGDSVVLIDEQQHPFKDIPIIRYVNNADETGDYEPVLTLIDAYDKIQSDTANDFEELTDSFLLVSGEVLDVEQALRLKEVKVFNFPNKEGRVEFVTKNINDSALENFKTRLDKDIHKNSYTPNMSDENFVGNSSGVSMAYKLQGLEFLTGVKEQKFKKGLFRRVELLSNVLNIRTNQQMNFTDVEFIFTRNNPKNLVEIVEMATDLTGIISNETQLDLLPMVDKDQELRRLEQEKKQQSEEMNLFDFNAIRQQSDNIAE
ncbi:MAG: phage portal protein [Clostridia bacterium]|nr:MAG: portal protein [Bacteriophage sp.]